MFYTQQACNIMRNIHIQATGEYWKRDFKKNKGSLSSFWGSVEVRLLGNIWRRYCDS